MDLDFKVSEIFPSLVIKKDLSDYITDEIKTKIDNIVKNMMEKIPLSEAFSSKKEVNDILGTPKFESLKDHIIETLLRYIIQQYQINNLTIVDSYIINVPKDGYFELRKNYGSNFHILINISDDTDIILQNPIYTLKSLDYDVDIPNAYNSQYLMSDFKKNESIVIPSGVYYGFPKREKELTLITITLR